MNRIKILGQLPSECYVAVSGGMDSMFVLDFLQRGRKDVTVLTFNHRTEFGYKANDFVVNYCRENNIVCICGNLQDEPTKGQSLEEFWRDQRYNFFSKFNDKPIITAHHLNDVLEWHMYTSIKNGVGRGIPYQRANFLRPFLATKKSAIESWVKRKEVPYIDDPSNAETDHMRNYIRHKMIPQALHVNNGMYKTIMKTYYSDQL